MMQTTFTKVLYQKRKMMLWWSAGIMAMTIFTIAFFPTFRDSDISQAFSQMPAAVQRLAGDVDAYRTIGGYVRQQIFSLRIPILTIILAIALFTGLSATDERSGRTEAQLTLPVGRLRLMLEKMAAGLVVLAVACVSIIVAVEVGTRLVGESYSLASAFKASFACFLLSSAIGLVAYMIGCVSGKKGLTLGIASGIAFGGYLITSLAATVTSLSFLDKLSFFHYYPSGPNLTVFQSTVLLGVCVISACIGLIVFNRRDIRV
jgi:ABC-2 type transport system permease protein